MKKIVYILLVALSLASCRKDDTDMGTDDPGAITQGPVEVIFSVRVPNQVDTPVTRAAYSDTDIENIDLLVFEQSTGAFLKRIKVDAVTDGAGGTKKFTARLDASNTGKIIHFVANGRAYDTYNYEYDRYYYYDYSLVEYSLVKELDVTYMDTASYDFGYANMIETDILPLIMWGRKVVPAITSNTEIDVTLLRSQAKISVDVSQAVADKGEFRIVSATLDGAWESGRVTPLNYTNSEITPTEPSTVNPFWRSVDGGDHYVSTSSTPVLYAYEKDNTTTDYLSIILCGTWRGELGYYKIVMKDSGGTMLDIVRNHHYRVTIVKAEGAGYPTLQQAIDSEPSNALTILTDDRAALNFVYADGNVQMGVSHNVLKSHGNYQTAAGLKFNIEGYADGLFGSGPQLYVGGGMQYNYAPDLTLSYNNASKVLNLSAWWLGAPTNMEGTIVLSYGRLRHTIYVENTPSLRQAPWQTGAGQTTYLQLFSAENAPWSAKYIAGSTADYSLGYNGGSSVMFGDPGCNLTEMTDTTPGVVNGAGYIYASRGTVLGNQRGIFEVTYMENGRFMKGFIILNG